jgi:transmembrane sensor
MSVVVRLRTRAEIDEEAATWTWRLDRDALGPEEQHAYQTWLRQNPRHLRAMEELSKVWGALDQLAGSNFSDRRSVGAELDLPRPQIRSRRHWWWFAAAAVVTVCIVGAAWL